LRGGFHPVMTLSGRLLQAILVSIDQYAEAATGNREYFLNESHRCSAIDVNGGAVHRGNRRWCD